MWFKCDHEGCETVAEALVPCRWYTSGFSIDPETIPDGWRATKEERHSLEYDTHRQAFAKQWPKRKAFCPSH